MIVDVRRYTLKPGNLAPYLSAYGEQGYAAQTRHLGDALGWFVADVGPQNHVLHLWGYEGLGQMEERRAAMAGDPDWIAARDGFRGLFAHQETQLMTAVEGLAYTRSNETPGLLDVRCYTLHHGKLPAFVRFLREEASAIQARHWPDNLAYLQSYSGTQNRVIHMWGHADHAERLARRQALLSDPDWQTCLKTILPMMAHMETFTATPAPFWSRTTPPEMR